MIWYIFKIAVLSLLIILLAHNIMNYLKTNLTSQKIKDYVTIPQEHYEKIATLLSKETISTEEDVVQLIHEDEDSAKELSEYMDTIL